MTAKLDTIFPAILYVFRSAKTLEIPLPSKDWPYQPNERQHRFQEISLTNTVDFSEQLSDHYDLCSFVFDPLQVSSPDNLHDLCRCPD